MPTSTSSRELNETDKAIKESILLWIENNPEENFENRSEYEYEVGNNVWLGDKVSILPGVHIGDGSVIGANSVVTHSIPPYSIAAGNPAKVLKTINE